MMIILRTLVEALVYTVACRLSRFWYLPSKCLQGYGKGHPRLGRCRKSRHLVLQITKLARYILLEVAARNAME
jgi:hypothetical protein